MAQPVQVQLQLEPVPREPLPSRGQADKHKASPDDSITTDFIESVNVYVENLNLKFKSKGGRYVCSKLCETS